MEVTIGDKTGQNYSFLENKQRKRGDFSFLSATEIKLFAKAWRSILTCKMEGDVNSRIRCQLEIMVSKSLNSYLSSKFGFSNVTLP